MKKLLLLFTLTALLCSCHNDNNKPYSSDLVTIPKSAEGTSDKKAVVQFDKTEFDFGKILQGEVVSYTFHFTNVGNVPLIITSIDKSCGCTAGDYPRDPIDPGQRGEIKITYDSKGHHGIQTKTVVVNSNAVPSQTSIRIKADVRTPDQMKNLF